MKTVIIKAMLLTISLLGADQLVSTPFANASKEPSTRTPIAPVVTNVTVSQRTDGTKVVDIWYDLYDANSDLCTVSFRVSADGGATFSIIPTSANVTGNVGPGIASGTGYHIIWHADAETYLLEASNFLYRIYADDGSSPPVPPNYVFVQGGTFFNGTSNVYVSDFYIDKYEMTQTEFVVTWGQNPSTFYWIPNGPVDSVSWFFVIYYCNLRSVNEGLTPCYSYQGYGTNPAEWPYHWYNYGSNHVNISCNWSADGYRLPTEMEWMFAAKGGNLSHGYSYSGSNDINSVAWYGDVWGSTHPVGSLAPNELGLYDMSGNVTEWCWDIYGEYPTADQINSHGPAEGTDRIMRGGWRQSSPAACTVWSRDPRPPDAGFNIMGFRLVRNVPQ